MMIASDETRRTSSIAIFESMSALTADIMRSTIAASTVLPASEPKAASEASQMARRIHMRDEKKIITRTPIQTTMERPNRESQSTRNTCLYWRNPKRHQIARTRYDSAESDSPDM